MICSFITPLQGPTRHGLTVASKSQAIRLLRRQKMDPMVKPWGNASFECGARHAQKLLKTNHR